jgi:hypothetical protein
MHTGLAGASDGRMSGGPPGYEDSLRVIFEPAHDEFTHFRGCAGGKFHAEEFDLKAVNKALERIR